VHVAVAAKRRSNLCTCRKECNKYDLTAAQCFSLAYHNDLIKSAELNLGVKNIFAGSHTEHHCRCPEPKNIKPPPDLRQIDSVVAP
jgi:hypothetical protein